VNNKFSERAFFASLMAIFYLIGCGNDNSYYYVDDSNCRYYATQYISYGADIEDELTIGQNEISVNCDFDETTLQLTCYANYINRDEEERSLKKFWSYESVSDFVEESKIIGKILYLSLDEEAEDRVPNILHGPWRNLTNIYNDQKILIATIGSDGVNRNYIEWDSNGRPTKAEPTGICTDDEGPYYEYDNSHRIASHFWNSRTSTRPPDGTIPCIGLYEHVHFDEYGNEILRDRAGVPTVFYDILKTEAVCY